MSISDQIDRIEAAKEAIATAITGKGVTVPDGTLIDGMAALIESIEAGSGGGANTATGTFTVSADVPTTLTTIASVHGLNFRPICIIVMLNQSKRSLDTTQYAYGCLYDTANNFYRTYSGTSTTFYVGYTTKPNTNDWIFTIGDDGFDLAFKQTSGGTVGAATYRYVAAG